MTQASSNTLAYHQIYKELKSFFIKSKSNEFKNSQERLNEYNRLLAKIYDGIGGAKSKYVPVVKGEPPMSEKINTFADRFFETLN